MRPTALTAYPAKKALKGKLVTSTQYTNWNTPESTINVKKASINLSRSGVFCTYDFHSADTVCDTLEGVVAGVAFAPAMLCATWNGSNEGIDPKRKS